MNDDQAQAAVRRHDVYFHDHMLKLVLGNCVRLLGVRETRRWREGRELPALRQLRSERGATTFRSYPARRGGLRRPREKL